MRFNDHRGLAGLHAEFSASVYHWIRYDDEKILDRLNTNRAAADGTRRHALAAELIRMRVRQSNSEKTLSAYVNDCIGYKLSPEQTLFYSPSFFGTADAIGFRKSKTGRMRLRIFDYKSGISPTKVDQLMVYAALFCLEYNKSPFEIEFDLRIYQNNECRMYDNVAPEDIVYIMSRIRYINGIIEARKLEEEEA